MWRHGKHTQTHNMKTTHTSGEWVYDHGDVAIGGEVCVLSPGPDSASRAEVCANARLIAACPELFALAYRVANLNEKAGEIGAGMLAQIVTEARAAVSKATGY